ncbi:MAG: PilT/PilU family type 4a pilus ATPase [Syntrophomonadaceae bacterium]
MSGQTVMECIIQGAGMGASDVHVMVDSPPVYRVNGHLVTRPEDGLIRESDMKDLIRTILPGLAVDRESAKNGQADLSISLPDANRARLNVYTHRGSWAAAVRILPRKIPALEELGLPETVKKMVSGERGLVLVSGTSGSGKSTTLASLVDFVNRDRSCHIITLEDPVEYLHSHVRAIINQREIGRDIPTFAQGLRSALRQDPDIIMVGEIRDMEEISIALTAAETGHLVLASVHSGNAVQTLERIIDVFPPHQQQQVRNQASHALTGIIHQKLFPRRDGDSRILAAEILVMTPAIRNMVRGNKMHLIQSALQTGAAQGMVSMKAAVQRLLEQNKISDQTAFQVAEQQSMYG